MHEIATDLGLHREFTSGPGFEDAARQHPGNGQPRGSVNGNGSRDRKSGSGGNGSPRTYSACRS